MSAEALACDGLQDVPPPKQRISEKEQSASCSHQEHIQEFTNGNQQHIATMEKFQQFQRFQAAQIQQQAMQAVRPQQGGNTYNFNFSHASNVSGLYFSMGPATQTQATLETGPRVNSTAINNQPQFLAIFPVPNSSP